MKTHKFDVAEQLDTVDEAIAYLEAAFEDGDPNLINAAIGDVARSRGMADLAREVGVARESLYRSQSADGNPSFITVLNVLLTWGIKLTPSRAGTHRRPSRGRPLGFCRARRREGVHGQLQRLRKTTVLAPTSPWHTRRPTLRPMARRIGR